MTAVDDRYADERWTWLDDEPEELDEEPLLPPGYHFVAVGQHVRLAHDLPDIADYQLERGHRA